MISLILAPTRIALIGAIHKALLVGQLWYNILSLPVQETILKDPSLSAVICILTHFKSS